MIGAVSLAVVVLAAALTVTIASYVDSPQRSVRRCALVGVVATALVFVVILAMVTAPRI